MFSCYGNDFDKDRNIYENWFTGFCMWCDLKIDHYWHAVRIPVYKGGGWNGCYCSWKCLHHAVAKEYSEDYTTKCYLDHFEQQVREIGIEDRISQSTEKPELPLVLELPETIPPF